HRSQRATVAAHIPLDEYARHGRPRLNGTLLSRGPSWTTEHSNGSISSDVATMGRRATYFVGSGFFSAAISRRSPSLNLASSVSAPSKSATTRSRTAWARSAFGGFHPVNT